MEENVINNQELLKRMRRVSVAEEPAPNKQELLKRLSEEFKHYSDLKNYSVYSVKQYLARGVFTKEELINVFPDKKEIIKRLSNDPNYYPAHIAKLFMEINLITSNDLLDVFPENVSESVADYTEPTIERKFTDIPGKIKEDCKEIYFWGLSSSGKTCALAGILNTINRKGYYIPNPNIVSGDYLSGLMNIFDRKTNISFLPNITTNQTIRYMNFKFQGNKAVAFIDLSGEVIKQIHHYHFYKANSADSDTIAKIKNLLNNNNRKIHFFIIDYHRHTQDPNPILNELAAIFEQEKYFKRTTDNIYILISKADMFECEPNQRTDFARFFFDKKYGSFKNHLEMICRKNEININKKTGEVDMDDFVLDFSIGNVYLQKICDFNSKSSEKIIDILSSKIKAERTGKWSSIFN